MNKLILAVLVIFALLGCQKSVTSGRIVKKYHMDATTRVTFISTGKSVIPIWTNVPEKWVFVLENCETPDKCKQGEMEVNQKVYDGFEVGNQYPSAELPKQ